MWQTQASDTGTEDSFLWRDAAGVFHALFHHMVGLPFPEDGTAWWLTAALAHAYSEDGKAWVYTGVAAGNSTAPGAGVLDWAGGGRSTVARQESPYLVIEPSGFPGEPLRGEPRFLVSAVSTGASRCARADCADHDDGSYTLVQPVAAAPETLLA